jgi:hypothetical protein
MQRHRIVKAAEILKNKTKDPEQPLYATASFDSQSGRRLNDEHERRR